MEDIPAARRSLVDLVVPIVVEALRQELGPDYDMSAVEPWLRDEGATWFDELSALYIDLAARNMLPWHPDKAKKEHAEQRLAAVNARHGLANLENDTVERFLKDKIQQLIKRRDGRPLEDKLVVEIFRWIVSESTPDDESQNRFTRRGLEIIQSKYQSLDTFKDQIGVRLARIAGVHHLFSGHQKFDYRQTMPGFVVETTGVLSSENQVRWHFDAAQAFPFGYPMRCRSLQPNEASQRAVFNDVLLKTQNDCERLVLLLKAKPEWRETLKTCATEKSRQPLFDLRKKVRKRNDFKERLQFDDLESLLKLAPQF